LGRGIDTAYCASGCSEIDQSARFVTKFIRSVNDIGSACLTPPSSLGAPFW
jgi:hypothetical protein